MEPLHLAHLVLLCLWGGLVAGESVLELTARDEASLRHAARVHYWMDLVVELPLLAGVLATGAVLAARAAPLSALHWVKITCGLVAVGVNVYCAVHVVARRSSEDAATLRHHTFHVRLAGLGLPFALAAAYLGFVYFRR